MVWILLIKMTSGATFGDHRYSAQKKAYKHLSGYRQVHPSFRWLWASSYQNKHKVFFWLLLKDRLNIQNLLRRKHWRSYVSAKVGHGSPFLHTSLTAYMFAWTIATNNIEKNSMGSGGSMGGRLSSSTLYQLLDNGAPHPSPISMDGWEFRR